MLKNNFCEAKIDYVHGARKNCSAIGNKNQFYIE